MAKIVKINPDTPDEKVINEVANVIMNGGIVIMPTDTVYGFHASPFYQDTLDRISRIKGWYGKKPFVLLIPTYRVLRWMGIIIDDWQYSFIKRIWPGPVSVIMESICDYGLPISYNGSMCFRVPNSRLIKMVLGRVGSAIISTSANITGVEPINDPELLIREFGDNVDLVVDAGGSYSTLPSTIVRFTSDCFEIVREGRVSEKSLSEILGEVRRS